jgi:hypothetical protein
MAANPNQVMRILDYRGINVRLDHGRLIGKSRTGPMPDDLIPFIQHFKDLIVAELVERERLAVTVANILQLTTGELVQYRQELATAPPGDPWIDHDRRALRMAESKMAERSAAA